MSGPNYGSEETGGGALTFINLLLYANLLGLCCLNCPHNTQQGGCKPFLQVRKLRDGKARQLPSSDTGLQRGSSRSLVAISRPGYANNGALVDHRQLDEGESEEVSEMEDLDLGPQSLVSYLTF